MNSLWIVKAKSECPYTGRMTLVEGEIVCESREVAIQAMLDRMAKERPDEPVTFYSSECPFGVTREERHRYLRRKTAWLIKQDREAA